MGDKNTEISVKASFNPNFGPPDRFSDPEETTLGASGMEISAGYNLSNSLGVDDFLFLGPRLDLWLGGVDASRYRSQVGFPVNDLNGLDERFDNPEYRETETVDSVNFATARAGVAFGFGPDTDFGIPLGMRVFMTAGPGLYEDYTIQSAQPGGRDQEQNEVTALSLKGGLEMLLLMKADDSDVGFVAGISGLRTYNPITRESEGALGLDVGLMVRF